MGTLVEGWNSTEGVAVEGGAKEGIAAGAVMRRAESVIAAAVALRLLSIMSAMWLRVELRALEIMMGFRSLVLLFDDLDDCFEPLVEGCLLLIDFASCLCFWPTSLIDSTEPIEALGVAWGWTDGGREEDGGSLAPEEEALGLDGTKDDTIEVQPDEELPRSGLTKGSKVVAWAASMLSIGE